MIKRNITETTYEYDKEGKLIRKTVTETHEEENNTITTYPSWQYLNGATPTCTYASNTISTKDYPNTSTTTTTVQNN